jgi:hypothetical protein
MGEHFENWEIEHSQWFIMKDGKTTFPYLKQQVDAILDEDRNDVLKQANSDVKKARLIAVAPKLLFMCYLLLALDSGGISDSKGKLRGVACKALREVVEEAEAE